MTTVLGDNMSTKHWDTLQKQTQQDWANREYIEIIISSIKKITDFLNSFGKSIQIHVVDVWFNVYFIVEQICHAVVNWQVWMKN